MKKAANIISKIISFIVMAVLLAIVIMNIYIIGMKYIKGVDQPTVFGYSYAIVLSGSMADTINVDDIVVTKKCDSYEKGDIIMFNTESMTVTHRINEVTDEGYITKGDANNAEDNWIIEDDDTVGKVVKIIPKAGRFIGFLQTPLGMLILVLLAFGISAATAFLDNNKK